MDAVPNYRTASCSMILLATFQPVATFQILAVATTTARKLSWQWKEHLLHVIRC